MFFISGEFVAQFKFVVLLMPNGPLKITGLPFEPEFYKSEHSVEDEKMKVKEIIIKIVMWRIKKF